MGSRRDCGEGITGGFQLLEVTGYKSYNQEAYNLLRVV